MCQDLSLRPTGIKQKSLLGVFLAWPRNIALAIDEQNMNVGSNPVGCTRHILPNSHFLYLLKVRHTASTAYIITGTIDGMLIKKSILAIILNILFGGVGYLYLKAPTRLPLGLFLTIWTAGDLGNDLLLLTDSVVANDKYVHLPVMLTLFQTIPGMIALAIMAADIFFLVKRQADKASHSRSTTTKKG
jgi:hypothetical protein